MELRIKRLSENARLPLRATRGSAGLDLFSAESISINPNSQIIVKTDLAIKSPENTFIKLADRSSLAIKKIRVAGGIIDSDFTGNISVILHNYGEFSYEIEKGQRICQMLIIPTVFPTLTEVEKLTETERSENGFGSSGL